MEKCTKTRRYTMVLRVLLAALMVGLMLVLYKTGFLQFFFNKEQILSFINSLGALGFLGFIVLQALQVVLAPIPGEVTGLIGGYTYGLFLGTTLSTAGLVLGSYLAFAIARTFGQPVVERIVDKSVMDRFDYLLHHKGLFLIFMLFLLPGFPKDYLCFMLGLGHLTTMEFLVVSSVGRLFGTVLLTVGGGFIRAHQYGHLSILVGVAIVIALLAYAFKEKIEHWLALLQQMKSHPKRCGMKAMDSSRASSQTSGRLGYKKIGLPDHSSM